MFVCFVWGGESGRPREREREREEERPPLDRCSKLKMIRRADAEERCVHKVKRAALSLPRGCVLRMVVF